MLLPDDVEKSALLLREERSLFRSGLPVLFLVGLWLLLPSAEASGQVVQGHLYDSETGRAVVSGNVVLRDSLGAVVARTATDEDGAYRIRPPRAGVYSIMAGGMGYRSTPTGSFTVSEEEPTVIDLSLYPQPIELDPLAVETRRRRALAKLREHGFYERQQQGVGSFLTPEQIRRWPAISVGDVLRHAPFVESDWNLSGSTVYVTRAGRRCQPAIYVDENKITSSPDNWVNPDDIMAVEVYRGSAQIPAQWGGLETCGVILIWTSLGGG